jgi:hypothetical protein
MSQPLLAFADHCRSGGALASRVGRLEAAVHDRSACPPFAPCSSPTSPRAPSHAWAAMQRFSSRGRCNDRRFRRAGMDYLDGATLRRGLRRGAAQFGAVSHSLPERGCKLTIREGDIILMGENQQAFLRSVHQSARLCASPALRSIFVGVAATNRADRGAAPGGPDSEVGFGREDWSASGRKA